MNCPFFVFFTLIFFFCVGIDSLPMPELGFDFVERHIRQQDNSTSGAPGSSSTGSTDQSQQMKPPQQFINPALSSGGTSFGSGSQISNPGGASGGNSQQLSQQFSPQNFVDPSFQNNAGMTPNSNSSQLSMPSSFINPSQFLHAGSAEVSSGSDQGGNQTSSGTNAGSDNSGSSGNSQLFQPPNQFIGQGSSGPFNFFNPASFIGK